MFFVTQWRAVRTTFGAISAPEQSSNVPPVPTRRATTPGTAWSPSSLEPPKMLGSEDPVVNARRHDRVGRRLGRAARDRGEHQGRSRDPGA